MPGTTQVRPERLTTYFDDFTKRFLRDSSPKVVDVEVVAPEWGDQLAADGARLTGITYDHKDNALDIILEAGDHRVYQPREVWVVEEADGFVSAIQIVGTDGRREVVSVRRGDSPSEGQEARP